jgi:hypothetical protein
MCTVWGRDCQVQVSFIDKISFLKAVKKIKTELSIGKIMASAF